MANRIPPPRPAFVALNHNARTNINGPNYLIQVTPHATHNQIRVRIDGGAWNATAAAGGVHSYQWNGAPNGPHTIEAEGQVAGGHTAIRGVRVNVI